MTAKCYKLSTRKSRSLTGPKHVKHELQRFNSRLAGALPFGISMPACTVTISEAGIEFLEFLMRRPPAFQFYADDFIGGTITMSHEARGLYILALCLQWNQGHISREDIERLGLGLASASLNQVLAKFKATGVNGMLQNERLEAERQKQAEFRQKQSENGRLGGRPKRLGLGLANPSQSSPSPSPSPSPIPTPNKDREADASNPSLFPDEKKNGKEKPDCYSPGSRVLVHYLNEKAGRSFREIESNLSVIDARLKEDGVDLDGCKKMIDRQCALWRSDPKMAEFLRPETLFGKQKFDSYYAARLVDVVVDPVKQAAQAKARIAELTKLIEKNPCHRRGDFLNWQMWKMPKPTPEDEAAFRALVDERKKLKAL